MSNKIGVLVLSYGTPESIEQIEEYYTHIRRGKPPTTEQLNELKERYEAIFGDGVFPLRENTNSQVAAIQAALNDKNSDTQFVCYQGLKHAYPFVEDGVEDMVKDGITEAIAIVLAPHYSTMSVGSYMKRAKAVADEKGIKLHTIDSYHLHPKLIQCFTQRVEKALPTFGVDQNKVKVFFSAHSLPTRILEMNDPYPDQLMETSKAIASQVGLEHWDFTWQSAGQTNTPWLGPDILDTLKEAQAEWDHILICPIGFTSDHLEILYDIDIECQQLAEELQFNLKRVESLNDDPLFISCLADVIWNTYKGE
ncbi:ferrochelatase [Longirhabdus pacifica]|uniref:ferrochelatase n=1 Tax=Longirhabdus pacifica TaxID=2305227 RepID=UPI0010086F58|nr:ferrochelatase [Longirhabdus pacifica]